MELLFFSVILFLFLLAVFDLSVGVSNDAVNFLNSALGTKAASFKVVIIIASLGVFIGASMSNGMMDIARHGIFHPEHFSFYDLIAIFMAVMVTDIILLDAFNSLGLPTSTTVSMVFELLGATFVVSLIKIFGGTELGFSDLLNTEKALSVIIGIFLSVAIAFVVGTLVQFLSRILFTFNYRSGMKWKIGIFGGVCVTAIVYFLLIKGVKGMSFMTPEVVQWISDNTMIIVGICLVSFTLLMQLLHILKVNVFKVIVLTGTFSLAMAFAGNDLVNFIGVPLSGLSSYQDYMASGAGDATAHMMNALNAPANTPVYFLIGAGIIMVVSLATSKKTQNVAKTEIGLGSQAGGDEMFGSSPIARRLVRFSLSAITWIQDNTPRKIRRWFGRRFNQDDMVLEQGAAFDLVRGSVNLVVAGALIALGTSLKLPLSTTFVTFMVAMGSSLADRAWGRESAVFRITGVISVIGGWFVTAGVAFIGAGLIVALMHLGGLWVMLLFAAITIVLIIRSNKRFRNKQKDDKGDVLFQTILSTDDKTRACSLFMDYIKEQQQAFIALTREKYKVITLAFLEYDVRAFGKVQNCLQRQKNVLKNIRRKETLCLRSLDRKTAIEKSAWFHLTNSCCMSILYNLLRINETCKEHIDNNFHPLPDKYRDEFAAVVARIDTLLADTRTMMETDSPETIPELRHRCDEMKDIISDRYHQLYSQLRDGNTSAMTVVYVYLNTLQETQEMVSGIRKYLRAYAKLLDSNFTSRPKAALRMATR